MKFTFLGTSAGRPTLKRNVSSLALEIENESGFYMFDCGEATQITLQKTPLSLNKLKAIFITHLHGDHIFGLFGVITSRMMDKVKSPLIIYAPKGLKEIIESVVDISLSHLGYELKFIEIYGGFEAEFDNFYLKVLPLIHSIQSYAFYIQEKEKIKIDSKKLQADGLSPSKLYQELKSGKDVEINGKKYFSKDYLIKLPSKRVIIAGDNAEPKYLGEYLKNLDLLIHEATYLKKDFLSLEKKYLHTTARDLALACSEYKVKNLIATHISPRYDGIEILKEIKEEFENVYVANDLDIFELKDSLIKVCN